MTREEARVLLKTLNNKVTSAFYDGDFWVEEGTFEAFEVADAALRGPEPDPETGLKGCWHCRNIEAHHIEYVIAVKAKGGTPMNMPVDCPYHYCPACGRKLEGV